MSADDDDFLASMGSQVSAEPPAQPPRAARARAAGRAAGRSAVNDEPEREAVRAGARARLELVLGEQLAPDPKPPKPVYPPLGAGLHLDIPADRYHADPCPAPALSCSIAKILLTSPLKAWDKHPKLGGAANEDADDDEQEDDREADRRDKTPSKDTGSVLDGLIFGGGPEIVEVDAKTFQSKAAKAARDEARARGAIPVLTKKLARMQRAAPEIKAKVTALLEQNGWPDGFGGISQATVLWQRTEGIWCKARMDHLLLVPDKADPGKMAGALIWDLKISYDASPAGADRSMNNYAAWLQRASYVDAIETLYPELTGRVDFLFIYCEPHSPWDGTANRCNGEMRDLGERQWRRAARKWAECLEKGEWPGYPVQALDVAPRPYILQQDEEQQLIDGGAVSGGSPGITF